MLRLLRNEGVEADARSFPLACLNEDVVGTPPAAGASQRLFIRVCLLSLMVFRKKRVMRASLTWLWSRTGFKASCQGKVSFFAYLVANPDPAWLANEAVMSDV